MVVVESRRGRRWESPRVGDGRWGAPGGNVGGAPPTTLGGAEFMQGVFTAIEQVVRNTMQTMQIPVRTAESRATTAMKTFLQLRPPTFKGEPDPLVAEDWLEQVTRALDTILVTEEDLRVLFASYQLQGDALQWWKTMEEVVAKKWEPFKKAFLDQYFTDTAKEALRMEFINLVQGSMTMAQYEAKFTSLSSAAAAIEENLNETRKIQNPKSQREGTSNQSEGRSSKKPRTYTTQQQYPTRVSSGSRSRGTISHPGTGTITSQGATYLLLVWSGGSYQSTVHAEGEQLRSYRIKQPTRSVQASRATPAFTSAQTSYQSRPQAVAQQGQKT
ncbi:hypothetical protein Acr_00g0056470 [Actinidia rufa]|uniref:Retrotransposon gag domain-containing protein n=1 Tax=Actinidia rufa TaxID=165716 RepID=A0A7J0DMF1_9ERIC|nr:hypothetical protein Acr_00g0056470 [Actinidia rufa]